MYVVGNAEGFCETVEIAGIEVQEYGSHLARFKRIARILAS